MQEDIIFSSAWAVLVAFQHLHKGLVLSSVHLHGKPTVGHCSRSDSTRIMWCRTASALWRS